MQNLTEEMHTSNRENKDDASETLISEDTNPQSVSVLKMKLAGRNHSSADVHPCPSIH